MDTDGGGWTVFQRREDNSVDFYRYWEEYKHGFGNICGEFWLGNDNIHEMTSSGKYNLRIDMKKDSGEAYYTVYESFRIMNESECYTLELGNLINGNTVDVLEHGPGQCFSTRDKDNDDREDECAKIFKGAWWFQSCYTCYLNGEYGNSFNCFTNTRNHLALSWAEMKMKRD
ncbi:ficolin-2-like [Antedon mediterranea]|uniref:ficolin-2-like n=1 Tax=Antedon mediterranea TaxID=105859 RepID=UPI003AF43D54